MIVIVKIVLALILAFIVVDFALVVVYHKKKKSIAETEGTATLPVFPKQDKKQEISTGDTRS